MKLKMTSQTNQQIGQTQYIIKEGAVTKLLLFLAGVGIGSWLLVFHFILGETWVYGISKTEIPSVLILALSVVLIGFGLYSLISVRQKSELQIGEYGILLNQQTLLYSEIQSVETKHGFFVKVIVYTTKGVFIYKASKFSHKDEQALDQVHHFIQSNESLGAE